MYFDVVGASDTDTSVALASTLAKEIVGASNKIIQEKENREKNIILFNVPESFSDVGIDRKKYDEDKFRSLCEHVVEKPVPVDKIYRLGKKADTQGNDREIDDQQNNGKKRPVKVCFKSVFDKRVFLSNLYKLKNSEFDEINVRHDLTEDERKTTKKLLTEASNRNESEKPEGFLYRVRGPPYAQRIVKIYLKKQTT